MGLIVLVVLILCQFNYLLSQINKNNFGPYVPYWEVFKTCKGPKPSNCGIAQIADATNMSDVVFHLELAKECPITMARVTISSLQPSNKTKKLFNYALDKPCQHFVLGPILITSFNLNNNCKINKGDYDIHLDMFEKSTIFLGPSFFYGTYEFKFMAFNKVNNFLCVESLIRIEKADKPKI